MKTGSQRLKAFLTEKKILAISLQLVWQNLETNFAKYWSQVFCEDTMYIIKSLHSLIEAGGGQIKL